MTKPKIPDDHRASRDLYDSFVALGREQRKRPVRTADPSRRRLARSVVLIPVMTLMAVATAAAAVRLLSEDGPPVRGEQLAPDRQQLPRDMELANARAKDPDGTLPWGVRIYPSAGGGSCALAGRVKDGRLGILRGERFSPFTPNAPGSCARRDQHLLIADQRFGTGAAHRSVLFGYADRTIRSIHITNGPRVTPIPLAADGSFVAVFASRLSGTLDITTTTGKIRRALAP